MSGWSAFSKCSSDDVNNNGSGHGRGKGHSNSRGKTKGKGLDLKQRCERYQNWQKQQQKAAGIATGGDGGGGGGSGYGVMIRRRKIVRHSAYGGASCPSLIQYRRCGEGGQAGDSGHSGAGAGMLSMSSSDPCVLYHTQEERNRVRSQRVVVGGGYDYQKVRV